MSDLSPQSAPSTTPFEKGTYPGGRRPSYPRGVTLFGQHPPLPCQKGTGCRGCRPEDPRGVKRLMHRSSALLRDRLDQAKAAGASPVLARRDAFDRPAHKKPLCCSGFR
jgi:hypothetical protein